MDLPSTYQTLHIWEGCHPKVAEAAQIFVNECISSQSSASVSSFRALVRAHLERSLLEVGPQKLGPKAWMLVPLLGEDGLAGNASDKAEIHNRLKSLAWDLGDRILPEIDTLREALSRVKWPKPVRVAIRHEAGLAGARRIKREIAERTAFEDWPYCELCYRPSIAAAKIELAGGAKFVDHNNDASARYCDLHESKNGRAYDADFKNRYGFKSILKAIFLEIKDDPSLRERFDPPEPDRFWSLSPPARERYVESIIENELPPISSYISNVRRYAYLVARRPSITRTTEIARLWIEGISMTDIATSLGVSRQTVHQHLQSTTGYFDFGRSIPALYWWPNDFPVGVGMLSLIQSKRKAR